MKQYDKRREQVNRIQKEQSESARDIAPLPEVADEERKEKCRLSFRDFCETYFAEVFRLGWSDDHLKAIGRIESAVLHGGLFALAMPRGSGKSTLSEVAAIWAMVYGHRRFVVLIGATETAAKEMMDSVKTEFEVNEALAADFPEACYPISRLEGIHHRANGQTLNGERTRITWTDGELVLPTVDGSAASGVVMRVAGLTGRIRGMKYKRPDGRSVRPELVIVDDPQTSESAGSVEQTRKRMRILSGDIIELAGPGKKISGIMPCTVIRPGDMADQILDQGKFPDWHGERCKLVYSFPTDTALWERYGEIRADSLRTKGDISEATAFYVANRQAMDAGAKVGWEERFNADEVSALQNAMNLRFRDPAAFAAEYQNEPLSETVEEEADMVSDEIANRISRVPRGVVPAVCDRLTAFVDVQKGLLFWLVAAWDSQFRGSVVDYGTFPDQRVMDFTLADARFTLQTEFPRESLEAQVYGGLERLIGDLMTREWEVEGGTSMRIGMAAIDANWGQSTDTVYRFIRQSPFGGIVYPSHGRYVGAASRPLSEWTRKPGMRIGKEWQVSGGGKHGMRRIFYDTNHWKSFVKARLTAPMGDRTAMTLYGSTAWEHRLLASHLTAEFSVRTSGRGRDIDEWRLRPESHDNHWWDCLVGCAVCASISGCAIGSEEVNGEVKRERVRLRLSDLRGGKK